MIKNLCEISSPSGGEEKIKEFIISELEEFTDIFFEDSFGNLIFIKKGSGDRICIECGIDEPFLMVSESDDENLRFSAPPHIKAEDFSDKDACFEDGTSVLIESEKEDNIKVANLFASCERQRTVGEYVTLLPYFKKGEKTFSAFNIKYKIPVFVLINVIKEIEKNSCEAYFVFSTQKCLANRGTRALMQSGIEFDKAISVSCIEEKEDGVLVMAKEKSCVLTPEIRKEIVSLSKDKEISVKIGFSEENFGMKTYLTEGKGALCGLICIPCIENSVNTDDVKDAENLIKAIIKK